MFRRQWLAVAGSFALLGMGLAPLQPVSEVTGDLKVLSGRWSGSLPDGETVRFKFDDTKATATVGDSTFETEVTLDEKAEPKKSIDFKIIAGPPDAVGQTAFGIYKFEKEMKKVVLCIGAPGQVRPEEFEEVEGAVFLFELERDSD